MIDFSLTEEQKMLRDTAHKFAQAEIRPVAAEIDRDPDPNTFPWELVKKAAQLGFTKMLVPEKYGGFGLELVDFGIVMEEIGWGDAAVASMLGVTTYGALSIARAGTEEQKERWLPALCQDDTFLIAISGTEPSGGSEVYCPLPDPELGVRTKAVKDGKHWVINGQKCWSTSGGMAKLYLVFARTDSQAPNINGVTIFLVPADTPGLTFGKVENKLGRRCQRNQEIFLDDVRVPEETALGGRFGTSYTAAWQAKPAVPRAGHFYMGPSTIGLARAAYEEALRYASERKIWGKPLREHQLVAGMLADMRLKIEAGRALVWKLGWAMDHPELSEGLSYLGGEAVKLFTTDMIVGIVANAMQILGAYGYTKECPMEKWMRDAMALSICGTANEVQRLMLAHKL